MDEECRALWPHFLAKARGNSVGVLDVAFS